MREARLVLDLLPGNKLRSGLHISTAVERLCIAFGGCTYDDGRGDWCPAANGYLIHDENIEFRVAMEPTGENWERFLLIGKALAAGQETVYIGDFYGVWDVHPVPAAYNPNPPGPFPPSAQGENFKHVPGEPSLKFKEYP